MSEQLFTVESTDQFDRAKFKRIERGDTISIADLSKDIAGLAVTWAGQGGSGIVGTLPRNGPPAEALGASGKIIITGSVADIDAKAKPPRLIVSLEVPTVSTVSYLVGLVGTVHYQVELTGRSAGDPITIEHELDNPYDDGALAAVGPGGETLGYVPRDSWLRDALLERGKGCSAKIEGLQRGESGLIGAVLSVTLTGNEVRQRRYTA